MRTSQRSCRRPPAPSVQRPPRRVRRRPPGGRSLGETGRTLSSLCARTYATTARRHPRIAFVTPHRQAGGSDHAAADSDSPPSRRRRSVLRGPHWAWHARRDAARRRHPGGGRAEEGTCSESAASDARQRTGRHHGWVLRAYPSEPAPMPAPPASASGSPAEMNGGDVSARRALFAQPRHRAHGQADQGIGSNWAGHRVKLGRA